METKQFFFKGKEFIITLNGENGKDTVQVIYPDDPNKYLFEFGHEVRMNKIEKYVYVNLKEEQWNVRNQWVTGDMKEFQATGQETFAYFYRMVLGNIDDLGTTLDKMVIDGFLIDRFDLQQGVFGNNGVFYYPIDFTYVVDNNSVTIEVQDKLIDEVYNYTILETGESNTTGSFTNLEEGSYTLLVESTNSMPCYQVVTITTPIQVL